MSMWNWKMAEGHFAISYIEPILEMSMIKIYFGFAI
jgi:hypothetical protein